jgi:MYXO-CTERM domain-containing protein
MRPARTLAMAAILLPAATARAHFVLDAPACWMSQDAAGLPEKLGPCGDEGGGTPTGIVTEFQTGQTITVTIDEKIFHPGHYRIALAVNDRSQLPAEPPVTAGTTPCGSVPIQNPPQFPVLADGVFVHTAPFSAPQTTQVTLPPNVTCSKCTLQVIEFMSDHPLNNPGGCFYHHCADISIQDTPVMNGDGGSTTGHAGCAVAGARSSVPLALLVLAMFVVLALRQKIR